MCNYYDDFQTRGLAYTLADGKQKRLLSSGSQNSWLPPAELSQFISSPRGGPPPSEHPHFLLRGQSTRQHCWPTSGVLSLKKWVQF